MCCRNHFSAIPAATCDGPPPLHNHNLRVKLSSIDCISPPKANTGSRGRNPHEDLSVVTAMRSEAAAVGRSGHHMDQQRRRSTPPPIVISPERALLRPVDPGADMAGARSTNGRFVRPPRIKAPQPSWLQHPWPQSHHLVGTSKGRHNR